MQIGQPAVLDTVGSFRPTDLTSRNYVENKQTERIWGMKKSANTSGKNRKRKKRRLRKPIRLFLWGIEIASVVALSNGIYKAVSSTDMSQSGLNVIVKAFTGSSDSQQETSAIGFQADWEIDQEKNSQSGQQDQNEQPEDSSAVQNDGQTDETSSSQEEKAKEDEEASGSASDPADSEDQNSSSEQSNADGKEAENKASSPEAEDAENETASVEEPIATILVDAGHGGVDAGMTLSDENGNPVWMEKDLNLMAAQEFRDAMAKINPRIRVEMIRDSDMATTTDDLSVYTEVAELTRRMDILKEKKADYYLSLHCNSGDASERGVLLFIKPDDEFSSKLSENVFNAFDAIGWSQSKSVITTDTYPLHVVTLSPVPSMLVEMGYMTNPEDLAKLVDPAQRTKLMEQLAAAYSELILEEKNPAAAS